MPASGLGVPCYFTMHGIIEKLPIFDLVHFIPLLTMTYENLCSLNGKGLTTSVWKDLFLGQHAI
jgi:hypothetical protein